MTGNPVNNAILQQFDKQRARGTQGFGLFDGQEKNIVREANEDKILKWLVKYDSNLIMFHHRFPTSTINVKRAAHPFSTKDYFGKTQYVLVHNGVISNPTSTKAKHEDLGIKYQSELDDGSFNDSESLLWDFALTIEGKQKGLTVTGSIAFVCIKLVKGKLEKMYFGRNVNPLNMKREGGVLALSSEGEGEAIDANTLYTYSYKLNRLTKREFDIPRYATYDWKSNTNYHASDYTNSHYTRPYENTRDRSWEPSYDWENDFIDFDDYGNPLYQNACATYEGQEVFLEAAKALEYRALLQAEGNFEKAYEIIENDYLSLLDDDFYNISLYEEAMESIYSSPDWIDEKSISPDWRRVCEQLDLT